jgi:hypothetical protein
VFESPTSRRALFFALGHVNRGTPVTVPHQAGVDKLAQKTRDRVRADIQYFATSGNIPWPSLAKRRHWTQLLKAKGHDLYPWAGSALPGVVMCECRRCGCCFDSASSFKDGEVWPGNDCPARKLESH